MTNSTLCKLNKSILLTLFCASSVFATDSALFHGKWGTTAQCAGDLIIPNGTKHWAPFEVSAAWLKHGDVWCRLEWKNVVTQEEGAYAVVHALCGEDDNRDYRINFNLTGGQLSLAWNNQLENRDLRRC